MPRHSAAMAIIVSVTLAGCTDQARTPTSPRPRPSSAARGASPTVTNVTSTVYDVDGSGGSLLTRSDDFNGSGFATYTAVNKVSSQITSDGAWQLYLGSQTARQIYLVLAGQGMPLPDGYYSSSVEVYTRCFDQNDAATSMLSMAAGASNRNCSFGIDFSVGRTKYKLVMGPTAAGTGRANVTCVAAAGGSCSRWTIVPNADLASAGVANLYHYGSRGSLVLDGVYHNSYSVSVGP